MESRVEEIRRAILNIMEMAEHSKSMSIGAKIYIKNKGEKALENLEVIELELMNIK